MIRVRVAALTGVLLASGALFRWTDRAAAQTAASTPPTFAIPAPATPTQVTPASATPAPASALPAVDAHGQLTDSGLQSRFESITKELRCLVCQNESIADSNADLALDLRRQVREMLVNGKSNDAIFKFMTDRYGAFVRFAPPFEPKTLLIWGAPFFMLLLGAGIIFRVVRQRSRMPIDE